MTLDNGHWRVKGYKQRVTREQLKELLLNEEDRCIIAGDIRPMRRKHLGVGVYEIWFETDTPKEE